MLNASIDLDAALESLTKKQELNDVHFTVRLVRDALRRGARSIALEVRRNYFSITHDGRPLSAKEHRDLGLVANAKAPAEQREKALFDLEKDGNLALFSALYVPASASLQAPLGFDAQNGILQETNATYAHTRVIMRTPIKARKAKRELRFYCCATRAQLSLNGRRLKPRRFLSDVLMPIRSRWWFPEPNEIEVEVEVGLPLQAAFGRTQFFKHGVYFGVKNQILKKGRVCTAWVDSFYMPVEENFRQSVYFAEQMLEKKSIELYDHAAKNFKSLKISEKKRVRRLFLNVSRSGWSLAMLKAPLFRNSNALFGRSLESIEIEKKNRGFITYSPHFKSDASLILDPFEVKGMQKLLGTTIKPELPPSSAKRVKRKSVSQATIPKNRLSEKERRFLERFEGAEFRILFAQKRDVWQKKNVIQLVFRRDDPMIEGAMLRLKQGQALDEVQYWLLGSLLRL